MNEKLTVRALCVKQNRDTNLISFYVDSSQLLKIADISRVKKNNEGKLLGYQRGAVNSHINEIVEYLNSEKIIFPNSIIMAMSSEVNFKQSRGPQVGDPNCIPGTLEIPIKEDGEKVAWIVDGQQRTMALTKSKVKDLMVPVTAFISDDFEVHRTQFLLVNKAKPLPNGLINELLPEVNTNLPASLAKNKIPSALCNILNKDPQSPFKGLIIRQTTDKKLDKTAVITDNSLIQVIKKSLNSAHGCLYQYRNVATNEIDLESVRKVLNIYWTGVKELFPEAWGIHPAKSRLMHGVGIKSMGVLMDRVMMDIMPDTQNAPEIIKKRLKCIIPVCAWTKGEWIKLNGIPWNQLQNTAGHIRLLSNMLIRFYSGVEKN